MQSPHATPQGIGFRKESLQLERSMTPRYRPHSETNRPDCFKISWDSMAPYMVVPENLRAQNQFQKTITNPYNGYHPEKGEKPHMQNHKLTFGYLGMEEWIRIVVPISPILAVHCLSIPFFPENHR